MEKNEYTGMYVCYYTRYSRNGAVKPGSHATIPVIPAVAPVIPAGVPVIRFITSTFSRLAERRNDVDFPLLLTRRWLLRILDVSSLTSHAHPFFDPLVLLADRTNNHDFL